MRGSPTFELFLLLCSLVVLAYATICLGVLNLILVSGHISDSAGSLQSGCPLYLKYILPYRSSTGQNGLDFRSSFRAYWTSLGLSGGCEHTSPCYRSWHRMKFWRKVDNLKKLCIVGFYFQDESSQSIFITFFIPSLESAKTKSKLSRSALDLHWSTSSYFRSLLLIERVPYFSYVTKVYVAFVSY